MSTCDPSRREVESETHLKVSRDCASADIDQFGHVVVRLKSPDAVLQIEVFVQLNGLRLSNIWVKLVRPVVARTQGNAVIGHILQEAGL